MRVARFVPSAALAPFVRAFEVVETREAALRTILPEPGLTLGFRFGGWASVVDGSTRSEVPQRVVMGMRATGRRLLTSSGGAIVLARLHAGGAAAFFDFPLQELFEKVTALESLAEPTALDATSARILAAATDEERVLALESFLSQQLAQRPPRFDPLVTRALQAIAADPGSLRILMLATRLGVSIDALEKRFRRIVGATPKQLASIMRLRAAVDAHDGSTLTRLAQVAGYYDQAHFNRHFAAVTGAAPRAFLSGAHYCV